MPRVMVAVPQIRDWECSVGDGVLGLLGAPLFYAPVGMHTWPAIQQTPHQIAIK